VRVSTVLLDFGGTLDAPGVHWSTQFARAFVAAGVDAPRKELDRAFLESERKLALAPPPAHWDLRAYVAHQSRLMAAELGSNAPATDGAASFFIAQAERHLAEAAATLRRHASLFRFGLVSNFPATLQGILGAAGLDELFGAVVISDVERVRKPDKAIFALALERLGSAPAEAAMIGDSLRNDVQGAKAAGLARAVWLEGDEILGGGDRSAADVVVRSLEEGLTWLGGRA